MMDTTLARMPISTKLWITWICGIGLILGLVGITSAQDLSFSTEDIDGQSISIEKQSAPDLIVVCFVGTECPLAKLYADRLQQIDQSNSRVEVIGIASNRQDSIEELKEYRARHKLTFPIIKDLNNEIADQFGAQRTPEVFLLDRDRKVIYRGRIDDQYQPGIAKPQAKREDLKLAIEQALANQPVEIAKTEPVGCLIGRVRSKANPDSVVTFSNQIVRLLNNHCAECHREGEIGPMTLTDYDEVVGWADMIQEVVDDGRMPPWHADPAHGNFVNERRMTEAEKQMLRDWVAAGTPLGDKTKQPELTQPTDSAAAPWRLPRQPDLVITMREKPYKVAATGTIDYQYFVVDPGFKEDKWVTAAEVLPGARQVVHHSIVFVRPPDGASIRSFGLLSAYVPGQSPPTFDKRYARLIPAGSKLVFQQHYTPNGSETFDTTKIGLIFGEEEEIEHEVLSIGALNQEFVIPPHANDYSVSAKFGWFPKDGTLHDLAPHMHFRGKAFQVNVNKTVASTKPATASQDSNSEPTEPGSENVLLNVPKYDFNWQHIYQFQEPIALSEVDSIEFKATFDNSASNPFNPDPSQMVSWGDQTWEEMAIVFATVSRPRKPNSKRDQTPFDGSFDVQPGEPAEPTDAMKTASAELEKKLAAIRAEAETFADDYFTKLDKDKNGQITYAELPRSTRNYGRWSLDTNGDGKINREEIIERRVRELMSQN